MFRQKKIAQRYFYRAIGEGNQTIVNECLLLNIESLRTMNVNFREFYENTAHIYGEVDPSADDNHAMIVAAKYGQLDIVKSLLSLKLRGTWPSIDPFANQDLPLDYNSSVEIITPLAAAAGAGQKEVVEFLLGLSGCNPSARNHEALRQACMNGHLAILEIFFKCSKVPTNTIIEIIQIILKEKGDPALDNNLDEILKLLFSEADEQINIIPFLIEICSKGYHKTADLLLSRIQLSSATVDNKIFDEALNLACKYHHIETVRLLLPFIIHISQETLDNIFSHSDFSNADHSIVILETLMAKFPLTPELINGSNGKSGVFAYACICGYEQMVKVLLDSPLLEVNGHISQIFPLTTLNHHFEIAKWLLNSFKEHLDPSYLDSASLYDACEGGDLELFTILLSDSRINPADICHYTLDTAIRLNRFEFIKLLLPDSLSTDNDYISLNKNVKSSKLEFKNYCDDDSRLEILKWLVKVQGIDHYSINDGYGEAFCEACRYGCIKIVEWFLSEPKNFILTHNNMVEGLTSASCATQPSLVKFLLAKSEWQCRDVEAAILAVKKTMKFCPQDDIGKFLEIFELLFKHDESIKKEIGKNERVNKKNALRLHEAEILYDNLQRYKLCFFANPNPSLLKKLPHEIIQEVKKHFVMNMN